MQFSGGVVKTSDGVALDAVPQYVDGGQAMFYLLPEAPVRVSVIVLRPDGASVPALTVKACG